MEDIDDDFGELYADVELQASSSVHGMSHFNQLYIQQQQEDQNHHHLHNNDDQNINKVSDGSQLIENDTTLEKKSSGPDIDDRNVENECDDDDDDDDEDDDFEIVVNDDDLDEKNVGGDARGCRGVEDEVDELVRVADGNDDKGKDEMWVENGGVEPSGGGYGGERGGVGKNGCNLQHKNVRGHMSGDQRSKSSRGDDREDIGYIQCRRPSVGRGGPSSGYVPGFSEYGNGFGLPWYRTILDVNIDMFEQKHWTLPGTDMTDYFNFGFDEESWKRYCQSVDQLRQQSLLQSRNQVSKCLRSKLVNKASAHEEIAAEVDQEPIPYGQKRQIGRAILVEDSNIERQPSMDARPPRNQDSDVVIEITVQDPEVSCCTGNEDSNDIHQTKCVTSENGRIGENVDAEIAKPIGSEHCVMESNSVEENVQSPGASSDIKRSHNSAMRSSHTQRDSSSQGKGQNSGSDKPLSAKVRGNTRAIETPNTSMEDADRNSIETNPRVAGIDLLFNDHIQSSLTPSDSDDQSKSSYGSDGCDLGRTRDSQRSSSDLVLKEHQVGEGYHVSRHSTRDAIKRKATDSMYRTRVGSPIEEDWKHQRRRVRTHSELNGHNDGDDNYHVGLKNRLYSKDPLRFHRHRSQERRHSPAFDDEDWPSYRKNGSSLGGYVKSYPESQIQAACMRESHRRDNWRSGDDIDMYFPREKEEADFGRERRIQRTEGEIDEREWYLHERERMMRDEKHLHNQPHFSSKYSSSLNMERWNQRRVHSDDLSSKRSRHDMSLEYRYCDGPALHRRASSYSLNGGGREYLDSDIEREKCIRHIGEVATSGRGSRYVQKPSLDYPFHTRDDDEYLDRQLSLSTLYYHDGFAARHDSASNRNDVDDPRWFQKHGRDGRYISPLEERNGRYIYDHGYVCDRQDTRRCDVEDDYLVVKQHVVQSKGVSWTENAPFHRYSDDDFYDEEKLDSFRDVSRHKWHGVNHEFVPNGRGLHHKRMKQKVRTWRVGGDNFCNASSKITTRVELSEEFHHVGRERKTLRSTGKCSKAKTYIDSDQKQQQKQQEPTGNNTKKVMDKDYGSDLEEGQIPTGKPISEVLKENNSRCMSENGHLKRISCDQKLVVVDENRILETMAKMEKRRERFQKPVHRKVTGSDPKPDVDVLIETAESKQQRPMRKRRWGGS